MGDGTAPKFDVELTLTTGTWKVEGGGNAMPSSESPYSVVGDGYLLDQFSWYQGYGPDGSFAVVEVTGAEATVVWSVQTSIDDAVYVGSLTGTPVGYQVAPT